MDPRYNWPPQAYVNPNGQYMPYAPPQPTNGYQQNGYSQQYSQSQMQMHMSQGYPQSQPYLGNPQAVTSGPSVQQYAQIPPQMQHQQQPEYRAQPQVVIPARTPSFASPMQMQAPKIRHVQRPVQRTSNVGMAQTDGAPDQHRQYRAQQAPAPPTSKPAHLSQSYQENGPRPQQRNVSTPVPNSTHQRTPLQPQATTQQRPPAQSQTPSSQNRNQSVQQPSSKPKSHPQVVISKPSSHQLTPTKHVHTPQKALPADLSVMLLSAADEYVAAARSMGSLIIRDKRETDLRHYYKLMSTAMGCMEAVLKDFSMLPRDEARLRLRYATLLVEETDNTTDIDEIISKQISLCGRCRLQDLKYATMHLQARYQFKTNHRAALKSLDKPISEAETFQHITWIYAFRFLKVSLTLQIPGRVEAVSALQQLHAILAHAEKKGDRAIYVACSALEALVHLRSGAPDRLEQAQRAIAAARSLQLQVSAKQFGSFGTLIDIIDIACGIQHGMPNSQKSSSLIEAILDENDKARAGDSGIFTVLVERSTGGNLTFDTGGVFRKSADGRDELVFAWLPKEDLKTLCFHICALDQNVHEKGLSYMKEAHQRSRGALKRQTIHGMPISVALAHLNWNRLLDRHSMFTIGLIACFREDRATASEALTILRKRVAKPPHDNEEGFTRTLLYLSAINDQASGFLDSAFAAYSSDTLALPDKSSATNSRMDIGILAALNRLLIVRNPAHSKHYTGGTLIAQLQPLCENHPNQYIRMAFRLVHAISSEEAAINRQKTLMQTASNRANDIFRSTQNREFVIMALCYFTMRFFADQVGEKSIQAIRATRQNAKLSRKPLWMAVAFGLCMSTYQRNGLLEEAHKAQLEFEAVRPQLPPALRGEEDIDAEGEEDAEGEIEDV
ncbi:Nn.00g075940.m01.CDS01 [Neocucurbitaria sp. VM-36]